MDRADFGEWRRESEFVEVPGTLWKKVPEEVRCGRKGLRFESERREVVQRGVAEVRCRARSRWR